MELHLQSMDQFPMQKYIILMGFRSIQSPKKFTLRNMEEILKDGIEHPKLLELLLGQFLIHNILISLIMELYLLLLLTMDYTNFLQVVKHKKIKKKIQF